MIAYEFYTFDEMEGYDFIGILPERRRNRSRMTKESVIKFGRLLLGDNANNKNIFFKRVVIDNNTGKVLRVNQYFFGY